MKQIIQLEKLKTFLTFIFSGLGNTGRLMWKLLTASLADAAIIPGKNLCISIGADRIGICYGSKFLSRIRIIGFKDILFKNGCCPDPEDFASNVFSAVNELGTNKSDITLSIPKSWAIIRLVEFPLVVKKELSSAVSFELDRLTPFSPENALYDFTIKNEKDDKICLLLIAAKAELVNRYIESLAVKDIQVKRVTVNLSGIGALLSHMDQKSDFIFVQTTKYGYEGGLITDGSISAGFTGSFSENEKPGYDETLVKEINAMITAHSGYGKPLKIIADFLNGAGVIPEHKLSMSVCNLGHMDFKLSLAGKSHQDIKKAPLISAGGMLESLQSKAVKPDLLCKGTHRQSKTPLALSIFLMLVISAIGVFHVIMPFKMEKQRLAEIDRQIVLIKDEAGKVEEIKKETESLESEIQAVHNFKHNSPMYLPILKELTIILPAKAWLTRIKITETTVEIEGYAEAATDILPKLEASSYFNKAEFASTTTRDPRKNVDRFAIKMEIRGSEKDKKEAAKK